MKLKFCGANRTTTGSRHLLEINGAQILLECGLFQGRRAKTEAYNTQLVFDPRAISVLLLSHAHIDHAGIIPVLCRDGFTGRIYCTAPTADLCRVMLMDSAYIQEQDAQFVSKKRAKQGLPPVQPLYTQADAARALPHLQAVDYGQPVTVAPGVTATWIEAGHILGSAQIILDIQEGHRRRRFAFTGDLGRGHSDILRDPEHPRDVDFLLTESTYGNRVHEPLEDVHQRICEIVQRALDRRGKIIIPSFAVGRTQQLLDALFHLIRQGQLPAVPVYVDSPLSQQATAVFRQHPGAFNNRFRALLEGGSHPFNMPNLTFIQSVEESMALNDLQTPAIIISASGMAEAGRVRHHIRNAIGDPRNTILIVGWCAQHTLGARLASGDKQVNIFGEPHRVRAEIETINAFSGHADSRELQTWAQQVTGPLRHIFVVHGEETPALTFASRLRETHPHAQVDVPVFGQQVEL